MLETDFNRWNDELTVPPVRDSLRLCDYLPAELPAEFLKYSGLPPELLSYTWLVEKHYDSIARWATAVVSAERASLPVDFFVNAISDAHNYDRALRAAEALQTKPLLRRDIPERITRWEGKGTKRNRSVQPAPSIHTHEVPYVLVEKEFEWDRTTPADAVEATARLLEVEAPDKLWIAEYVEEHKVIEPAAREAASRAPRTWDPIIYAQYGDWQVEVARWD